MASTQHVAWMLVNLLARLEGVVAEIVLEAPDSALVGNVCPLAADADNLHEALEDGVAAIGGLPLKSGSVNKCEVVLTVGPGASPSRGWRVHGEGFCGSLSKGEIVSTGDNPLPFGPYVAACLAAAEVFRLARLPEAKYTPTEGVSFSLLDYEIGSGRLSANQLDLPTSLELDFGLAGVGAVGCAALHALWACPGLCGNAVVADADPDGVDKSNLNRCAIFGSLHIGLPKASTAAELLAGCGIAWDPVDDRYTRNALPRIPDVLLSAVDTNGSRISIQEGFWPARLFGASTLDCRAEVVRFGPPADGPCLCCFNPPEIDIPDDLRREELRQLPEAELLALANKVGVSYELVRRWAEEGGCGAVADVVLNELRRGDESPQMFSVGFVSVFAGTALAAELVKEFSGLDGPLDDKSQLAKFQFLLPSASENGAARAVRRDLACRHCEAGSAGVQVWERRARSWRPGG